MAGDPVEVRECQSDEAHPRTCIGVSYMDGLVLKAIVLVVSVGAIYGFAGTANRRGVLSVARSGTQLEAITEVGSLDEFDTAVSAAGANVVVIDYSTTWCGPCKFVFPKYEAMSEKYENVVFLKCIGDTSVEASKLMKREGVRSVPAFHVWKEGTKVDTVNGARIEEVENSVKQYL